MPGYAIDDTSQYTGKNNVNYIDSACAWDEKSGRLTLFVINRNEKESYPLDLDVRGFAELSENAGARFAKITHYEMYCKDFEAKSSFGNDWKAPEAKSVKSEGGIATLKVEPLSWNVIVFEK